MITYIAVVRVIFFILTVISVYLVISNTRGILNARQGSYVEHNLKLNRLLWMTLAIVFFAVSFLTYLPKNVIPVTIAPAYDRPSVSTEITPTAPRTETLDGFQPLKRN